MAANEDMVEMELPIHYIYSGGGEKYGRIYVGEDDALYLPAREQKVSDLKTYFCKIDELLGDSYTIMPVACIRQNDIIITEVYAYTLEQALLKMNGDIWDCSNQQYLRRMNGWLRDFFREMITRLVIITEERKISYEPTVKTVVLDCDYKGPKFILNWSNPTTEKTTQRKAVFSKTWQGLKCLLQEIIKNSSQLMHCEIESFRSALETESDKTRLRDHPALLSSMRKLDYIIQFGEAFSGQVKSDRPVLKIDDCYKYMKDWAPGIHAWVATISKDGRWKTIYNRWQEDIKKKNQEKKNIPEDLLNLYHLQDSSAMHHNT